MDVNCKVVVEVSGKATSPEALKAVLMARARELSCQGESDLLGHYEATVTKVTVGFPRGPKPTPTVDTADQQAPKAPKK